MAEPEASRTIEKIKAFLKNDYAIQQAILFGSYATGTNTNGSDIDLAIQLRKPMTVKQKLSYLEKLQDCTEIEIDLVDLQIVGQPLLSQIMKYGKRLKGDSVQYAELVIKNINTATDFIPYIKRILNERRKRLLDG